MSVAVCGMLAKDGHSVYDPPIDENADGNNSEDDNVLGPFGEFSMRKIPVESNE